jgi:DNA-binding beta-propeller fold protein YncE
VLSAVAAATLLAFVAAEDDDRLVVVDLERKRVVRRIHVADGPHNVAASWDGRFVLVTSPPAGRVTLVSGCSRVVPSCSLRVLKVFRGLAYPHDVEISPDGRFAYVTEEHRGRIAVINLERRRVVRRVGVGSGPHDLAVSPDGGRVWVTHGRAPRTLTIVDSTRPWRAAAIGRTRRDRAAPHDIFWSPTSERVFVTYWDSPLLGVYRADTGRVVARRRAGVLPHHVAVGPEGNFVWVTDHGARHATIFAGRSARRLRVVRVGREPHHAALLGGRAVVASHRAGTITVHRAGGRRLFSMRVGSGGLHGVALALVPR